MSDTNITASNGMMGKDKAVVTFDGSTVIIKKGTFGRTEIRIPVSKITTVGWHKSLLGKGHVDFIAAGLDGKVEFRPGLNNQHTKEFEALRAAINEAVAQ